MAEEEAPGQVAIWEQYKLPFLILAFGLLILIVGLRIFLYYHSKPQLSFSASESTASAQMATSVTVDISGAVEKPGLYTLPSDSRVQDALDKAGGLSSQADQEWVGRQLNLAQKLTDGSKLYIPKKNEIRSTKAETPQVAGTVVTATGTSVNINTASEKELESLPGIGEVTAAKIISNRPYQSVDELLSKKILNKTTFEKNKGVLVTY
ncbi:TPA: competence protein CelA [Patescibacteria group bacterium]|uniref:ComEA family protein/general secretion pathway protein K n=1 Tax=Candidatus Gottesmanbacteria bacterium GW2011_GWA1_43_11 TaxID=1618436 RepID=A0A0G1ESG6_9BACT|nr:MAG: ComEA family protein/general secretion pathway protein K [Candidatus Gottesmanbacteria bacterium GW2011_GWA1_43_11]HCS78814.1 competence protein CelA [Patescibacteria group bacterium]